MQCMAVEYWMQCTEELAKFVNKDVGFCKEHYRRHCKGQHFVTTLDPAWISSQNGARETAKEVQELRKNSTHDAEVYKNLIRSLRDNVGKLQEKVKGQDGVNRDEEKKKLEAEIGVLKKELLRQREKLRAYKDEINFRRDEINSSKATIKSLEEEIALNRHRDRDFSDGLTTANADLERKMEVLKKEFSKQSEKLHAYKNEVTFLRGELASSKRINEGVEDEFDEIQKELEHALNRLKEQELIEKSAEYVAKENTELMKKNAELEGEIETLRKELLEQGDELHSSGENNERLKNDIDRIQKELEIALNQLKEQNLIKKFAEDVEKANAELLKKNADLEGEVEVLEEELLEQRKRLTSSEESNEKLKNELERALNRLEDQDLTEMFDGGVESEHTELLEKNAALVREIEASKEEFSKQSEELRVCKIDVVLLKSELESSEKTTEGLRDELTGTKTELENVRSQLEGQYQNFSEQFAEELTNANLESMRVQEELSECQGKVSALEKDLRKCEQERGVYKGKLESCSAALANLESVTRETTKKCNDLHKQLERQNKVNISVRIACVIWKHKYKEENVLLVEEKVKRESSSDRDEEVKRLKSELKLKETSEETARKEIEDLKRSQEVELGECQREIRTFKQRIAELEDDICQQGEKLIESQRDLAAWKAKFEQEKKKLGESQMQNEDYRNKLVVSGQRVTRLEQEIVQKGRELSVVRRQLNDSEQRIGRLGIEMGQQKGGLDVSEQRIAELEQTVHQQEEELNEARQCIQDYEGYYDDIRIVRTEKSALQQRVVELEQKAHEQERRLEGCQRDIHVLNTERSTLQQVNAELREKLCESQRQGQGYKDRLDASEHRIAGLETEVALKMRLVRESQRISDDYKARVDGLLLQMDEQGKKLSESQRENRDCVAQLYAQERRIAEFEENEKDLPAKLKNAGNSYEILSQQYDEAQNTIAQLKREKDELNEKAKGTISYLMSSVEERNAKLESSRTVSYTKITGEVRGRIYRASCGEPSEDDNNEGFAEDERSDDGDEELVNEEFVEISEDDGDEEVVNEDDEDEEMTETTILNLIGKRKIDEVDRTNTVATPRFCRKILTTSRKRGRNGKECGIILQDGKCWRHDRYNENKEISDANHTNTVGNEWLCSIKLKSGLREGQPCNQELSKEGKCRIHDRKKRARRS